MILILAFALMPISSTLGFDSTHNASNCELALSDSIDRDQNVKFEESDFTGCQDFSACAVHYGCAPLQSSSVLAVIARALEHRTISIGDCNVSTRYLSIPERPPKV